MDRTERCEEIFASLVVDMKRHLEDVMKIAKINLKEAQDKQDL